MSVRFENSYPLEGGNFHEAGRVSIEIRNVLKELGISDETQRRASIAAYESEMNVIAHACKGCLALRVTEDAIYIDVKDVGPGIDDIERATQEGRSTAGELSQEMGFGAGMGLSNIKDCSDVFDVVSEPEKGTHVKIVIYINKR